MQNQKGFTIIELIVVIAIIAVLAGIVLISVSAYTMKSKDASIKSMLSNLYSVATIYYEKNGTFSVSRFTDNICDTEPKTLEIKAAIEKNAPDNIVLGYSDKFTCYADKNAWAACSLINAGSSDFFCVDSAGFKGEVGWDICGGINATSEITNCTTPGGGV